MRFSLPSTLTAAGIVLLLSNHGDRSSQTQDDVPKMCEVAAYSTCNGAGVRVDCGPGSTQAASEIASSLFERVSSLAIQQYPDFQAQISKGQFDENFRKMWDGSFRAVVDELAVKKDCAGETGDFTAGTSLVYAETLGSDQDLLESRLRERLDYLGQTHLLSENLAHSGAVSLGSEGGSHVPTAATIPEHHVYEAEK